MKIKKFFLLFLAALMLSPAVIAQKTYDDSGAEKLEWKLAVQAWSFRKFTLEESLDMLNQIGVKYIEMYPGQQIGAGIEGTTHYGMNEKTREELKKLLDEKGIKAINYGVTGANSEDQWRQLFEFADYMGIETILSEPEAKFYPVIDELCEEFEINLGIHNHPIPNRYWHPDFVLNATTARSKRFGASPDIGHWVRSGLDPVKWMKKLKGNIISLHMSDLNDFGVRKAHDVPWGTGVCNMAGVLHELKNQEFKGVLTVEYEYNWDNSLPEIKESVEYFRKVTHWLTTDY